MNVSLIARGVSLEVPIYLQNERSAKTWFATLLNAAFDPPRRETRTVLSDIGFEAHDGDRIALIGRNGAGKSTLLRVLNGAFTPTRGAVEVNGSCQALLNVSLGFNAEATVRENIFLRGTAIGLRSSQIRHLIEPVVEFAGLTEKIGHRLKTLSAGQRMRLGFAISTSVQHDIMLMDEWIGTGDTEFIAKAKERLAGRVDGSRIVVLASHNAGLLNSVCNKGIVLERGRMIFYGGIKEALASYRDLIKSVPAEAAVL
ncbi:ABC transporter ATP-binding protein [Montanilutibacter psychrotolerans]|uniref:ABC transporter ATP-binding protein n=1 Tax=Montanilutibacter psychrotolerans TaxID=1327343 RepID=A0A3M8SSS3_9GAMM|nr:ATP-binding cassette domain-containing protein [Lysobacter psychrotolerans]RNF84361.1 ABC transporter ATP-binding protein [Lysobacter psychrotolerans]